jgi:hypothetical protein
MREVAMSDCLFDELTCRCLRPHCATHPRLEDADRAATPAEIAAAFTRDARPERMLTIEQLQNISLEEIYRR